MMSVERFLTIISLSIAILGALGTLTWKTTRALNRLLDLPEKIEALVKELKKMNARITGIRWESRMWRKEHMRKDHMDSD